MADRLQGVRVFAESAVLSGATRPLEASGALLIDAALIEVKIGEPVQPIKRESARRHVQIFEHGMNGALRNSGSNPLPGNLIGSNRVSHADHCHTTSRNPEATPRSGRSAWARRAASATGSADSRLAKRQIREGLAKCG